MDLELKGHVAVITGGASGIGAACTQALVREGCRVAIWDLTPGVTRAAGALAGHDAIRIPVDVADLAAGEQALDERERALGKVDHLVHTAATGSGKFGFPFTNLRPALGRVCWK